MESILNSLLIKHYRFHCDKNGIFIKDLCPTHAEILFNKYMGVCAHAHVVSDASLKSLLNCNSSVVCQTQCATSYLSATKEYKPIGK